MQEQIKIITCSRCGYRFSPREALRCPRCNKPVFDCGGCSGACSKCLTTGTCKDSNGKMPF